MFKNRKKHAAVKMAHLSTLIAQGVEINGDLTFSSGMRIDGTVKGNLVGLDADGKGATLFVLSGSGRVEGSVKCGNAVINGEILGDLDVAQVLELQSDAKVSGTIRYRQLQMEAGAQVQGQLVRLEAAADNNIVEFAAEKIAAGAAR